MSSFYYKVLWETVPAVNTFKNESVVGERVKEFESLGDAIAYARQFLNNNPNFLSRLQIVRGETMAIVEKGITVTYTEPGMFGNGKG